eukprot:188314-Karenia_brevis.AAC.1
MCFPVGERFTWSRTWLEELALARKLSASLADCFTAWPGNAHYFLIPVSLCNFKLTTYISITACPGRQKCRRGLIVHELWVR